MSNEADSPERLSDTIALIYECILQPDLWPTALAAICGFVGGVSANVFWHDLADRGVEVFHSYGEDLAYTRSYAETYRLMNPYFPTAAFFPAGVVITGADMLPHDQFRQTRFYREWVRPQGWVDMLASNLTRSETAAAFMSVRRSEAQGVADAEAVRRMGLLTPHVQRAVLITRTVQHAQAEGETLEDILEVIAAGVFLVDAEGHLLRANTRGQDLLANARQIRAVGARLEAVDTGARSRLAAALRQAGAVATPGVEGVAVPLEASEGDGWFAHVLPLPPTGRTASRHGARAAVFVRRAELDIEPPLAVVSRLHGLSPAETRVLGALVELGGGVRETARALGLSTTTIRAHLRRLFDKTGTARQAELVRLVLAHRTVVGA